MTLTVVCVCGGGLFHLIPIMLLKVLSLGFSFGFIGSRTSWDYLLQTIILPSYTRVKEEQQPTVGKKEWGGGLGVPFYPLLYSQLPTSNP